MTLEEAEIEKIKLEIEKLKLPFWKNPAYLTIIATIIIGFSSYYVATDKAKAEQIETLIAENRKLEQKKDELEKAEIERKAEHNQRKFEDFKLKNDEIQDEILIKEIRLNSVEDNLEESKMRVQSLENQYTSIQEAYEEYKSKVYEIMKEVENYGPGYADGLINSLPGQAKIDEIITTADPTQLKQEIERFALRISEQAFNMTMAKKKIKLDIN